MPVVMIGGVVAASVSILYSDERDLSVAYCKNNILTLKLYLLRIMNTYIELLIIALHTLESTLHIRLDHTQLLAFSYLGTIS